MEDQLAQADVMVDQMSRVAVDLGDEGLAVLREACLHFLQGPDASPEMAREVTYSCGLALGRGYRAKDVSDRILTGAYTFSGVPFRTAMKRISEHDRFAGSESTVEEGIFECRRCSSRKTYSFSKQTRSADEVVFF